MRDPDEGRVGDGTGVSVTRRIDGTAAAAALRVHPHDPKAANAAALAAFEAGDRRLAERLLRRAVSLAPGLDVVRSNLDAVRSAGKARKRDARVALDLGAAASLERWLGLSDASLTACILVHRRGLTALDACLASLGGRADEIVLIDATGGEFADRASRGATEVVVTPPIDDDACAAWNAGLHRARSFWILTLEADERLEPEALAAMDRALGGGGALRASLVVRRRPSGRARREIRLVRNAPDVAFVGKAHPQLRHTLKPLEMAWGLGGVELDAEVVARDEDADARDARARVEPELVAADIRDDPSNVQAWTAGAAIALRNGDMGRALEILGQVREALAALGSFRTALDLEEPVTLQLWAFARAGRFEELLATASAYHAELRPTANTLFLEGVALRATGRPREAAERIREAAAARGAPGYVDLIDDVAGPVLPTMLAVSLMDAGELTEAEAAFEQALRVDPDHLDAKIGLLGLTLARGDRSAVLQGLDALVASHGHDPAVWHAGSILLGRLPALASVALDWVLEARARFPEDVEIRTRLAEGHLRCGRGQAALETWDELAATDARARAGRFAAALACGRDVPEVPSAEVEATRQRVLEWFRTWLAAGAYEALDRALVALPRTECALAGLSEMTADWLDAAGQPEAASRLRSTVLTR